MAKAAGDQVAVAGDGGVMLFDVGDGHKLKTIDSGSRLSVIVRHAGDVMAAVQGGNLWLFDASGRLQRNIKHDYQVFSLALSPDGSTVISGDIAGRIRRFRAADGAEIQPTIASGTMDFVNDVKVSADGLYLAAAMGGVNHGSVRIWRMVDAAPVLEIPGPASRVAFSPDASEILVVSDTSVDAFRVLGGAKVMTYGTGGGVVSRIAYSDDGSRVAASTDNNDVVKIFDRYAGTEQLTLSDESQVRPPEQLGFRDVSELAFTQKDARLVVAWRSGRLATWRLTDGALVWSRLDHDTP